MPVIKLTTEIKAPADIVFDLSRSVELHTISTSQTHEEAVAGVTSGLMGPGDQVTWRAKHLGIYQKLTSEITEYNRPVLLADSQVRGAFKRFTHVHRFRREGDLTIMEDNFDYTSPLGLLGCLADWLFLERYMTKFLLERNKTIKEFAESGRWREVLH